MALYVDHTGSSAQSHPFPSKAIWGDCNLLGQADAGNGFVVREDFVRHTASTASAVVGPLATLNDTGTVASIAGYHQVQLATGGTTDKSSTLYLGPNIAASGLFKINFQAAPKFWAECRVKTTSAALANQGSYFGLVSTVAATSGATILGSATTPLATESFVGWLSAAASAPKWGPIAQNLSTLVEYDNDYATIVLDTWVKLGIKIDGTSVKYFYNGTLAYTLDITTSALPAALDQDIFMNLMLHTKNSTGTTKLMNCDWIMCAATEAAA